MKNVTVHSLPLLTCMLISVTAAAEETKRLEEVVVYGEKVEATVSDTSIAITAMDEDFIMDMGLQDPN